MEGEIGNKHGGRNEGRKVGEVARKEDYKVKVKDVGEAWTKRRKRKGETRI